jgi:hypothetical protein
MVIINPSLIHLALIVPDLLQPALSIATQLEVLRI